MRARTAGLTAADVDRELDAGSLVVSWLNRGTLHLVRAEDHGWLHALTTPPLVTGNRRRLAQEGVSEAQAARGVAAVERALADRGPLPRSALREVLDRAGVPTGGQALVHVLFRASLLGLVVRGPTAGRQHAFALVRDWLGEPARVDREAALRELGVRFLAGHGPAGERDLAKWAGIRLTDARAALRDVTAPRHARAGKPTTVGGSAAHEEVGWPAPRLLGAFDPVLLGWVDRTPVVGDHLARIVGGGLFRPFALVDGRAAGVWALREGEVALEPFRSLPPAVERALAAEAADVRRFLALR